MADQPGYGATFYWDPAGGTAWSNIGQVKDTTMPNITTADIDTTTQDDAVGDYYRTYLPGIPDAGNFTFEINWDPNDADHAQGVGTGLLGNFEQNGCTMPAWRVTPNMCSGTAIWTFDGYVNSFSGVIPLEGVLTASVSVKISGKPTLTVS